MGGALPGACSVGRLLRARVVCVPGCLHTWMSVRLDVDPVVWWSVALGLLCLGAV